MRLDAHQYSVWPDDVGRLFHLVSHGTGPGIRDMCQLSRITRELAGLGQLESRENGRRPKRRAGLPATSGAVADIQCKRIRQWSLELDSPALAVDLHRAVESESSGSGGVRVGVGGALVWA